MREVILPRIQNVAGTCKQITLLILYEVISRLCKIWKFWRQISVPKSSRAMSRVSVEFKTIIIELSSSIMGVSVLSDHVSLIGIPVCHIYASSCQCIMQPEGRVTHLTLNPSPCLLTWCPCCQVIFLYSILVPVSFGIFLICVCWSALMMFFAEIGPFLYVYVVWK
jgi:hypothetical protein